MKASACRIGHHQVWARDSMITLLGARFAQDDQIQTALRASVALLRSKQSSAGAIPIMSTCDAPPDFRAYADGGLWWIIGSSTARARPRRGLFRSPLVCVPDVDQSGLISMQESADWQDLFCTRGKGLYLNCLYVLPYAPLGQANRHATYSLPRQNQSFFLVRGRSAICCATLPIRSARRIFEQQDSLGRKRWLPVKRHLTARVLLSSLSGIPRCRRMV